MKSLSHFVVNEHFSDMHCTALSDQCTETINLAQLAYQCLGNARHHSAVLPSQHCSSLTQAHMSYIAGSDCLLRSDTKVK